MNASARSLQEFFSDRLVLPGGLDVLRETYRSALPFPHVIIDGLFSPAFLVRLIADAPQPGALARPRPGAPGAQELDGRVSGSGTTRQRWASANRGSTSAISSAMRAADGPKR